MRYQLLKWGFTLQFVLSLTIYHPMNREVNHWSLNQSRVSDWVAIIMLKTPNHKPHSILPFDHLRPVTNHTQPGFKFILLDLPMLAACHHIINKIERARSRGGGYLNPMWPQGTKTDVRVVRWSLFGIAALSFCQQNIVFREVVRIRSRMAAWSKGTWWHRAAGSAGSLPQVMENTGSIDECKQSCREEAACQGIEFAGTHCHLAMSETGELQVAYRGLSQLTMKYYWTYWQWQI